ncbi:MAG: exonuclease domain-containing protein [Oscillospiraceae bacterium]|nr:exonuclease domain-containing protein [Oscillospiraceae bacterium]
MNYIILDMEWNQALNRSMTVRSPIVLNGEIIQIGAVKTDENFELLDRIKINVRPKFYKKMNPYVEEITGISSIDLTCGENFPQAFRRFSAWCGNDFRFITWGFDDIGILSDNLKLHGLDESFGRNYINLQLIYNRQTDAKQLQCSLSSAAENLGIPIDVQVHDAANDAYLTYEICKKLNMVLGVAEYAELSSGISEPIFKDAVQNVEDCKTMLRDRRVTELKCPECGKKIAPSDWLFSNGKNCRTVMQCECERAYTIKLKAVFVTEGNYTVVRSVYAASEEEVNAFSEKLRQKAEAKERRKKKELEKKNKEA